MNAAAGMTGEPQWAGQGLALRDSDVTLNRLIVESDRDSRDDASAMDSQSRFLLMAVIGAWTGFLGLMAVVATDEAIPQMLGAVGLVCGLVVAVVGLRKVVRDRPGYWAACGPDVEDSRDG